MMYRSEYGHTVSPPVRSVGMVGGGGQQVMYRFANDRVAFVRDRLGEGARGAQQKKGKAATFDEQRRKRALLRKKLRLEQQAAQPQGTTYWTTHEGKGHDSLRAGRANALHLSGYSDREIMKMGRWRSATFMEYISEQLSAFTKGMSTNMRRRFNFVNVKGAVLRDITKECINSLNN